MSNRTSASLIDRLEAWIDLDHALAFGRVLSVAMLGLWIWIFLSGHGLVDGLGRPMGTDFSSFWTAGYISQQSVASTVYDPARHYALQKQLFGENAGYYAFYYPPTFLLVAKLLALFPYRTALFIWQATGVAAYVLAMRKILPHAAKSLWVIIGFPAVFLTLGHGQNSFLTTALFVGGLLCLAKRPIVAGICFGLLAYKPHLAILIPVALIASQQLKAFSAAAVTVGVFAGLAVLVLGTDIFPAYRDITHATQSALLENGGPGWHKIQTMFAAVRAGGGSIALAYSLQAITSLTCAALTFVIWRSGSDQNLKYALLCTTSLIATPFVLDYDLLLMAGAMAFFVRYALAHGWQRGDRLVVALAFMAPMMTRTVAEYTLIPLGLISLVLMTWIIVRRWWPREESNPSGRKPSPNKPGGSRLLA
jgi:alpha-1,2-mannosyltransferase